MPTEQITVIAKGISQLKGFVQLRQNLEAMQRAGINTAGSLREVDNRIKKMGVNVKRSTIAFRRFRAELLSVMFFGMAISRVFSMMLQPALQMVGLFESWTNTLAILFLPIALKLLEFFLPFMDFLLNLPEPIQLAIGAFVIFAAILGKLLFLVGTLGLGIFGLTQVFGAGFVATIKGWLVPFFKWLGVVFSLPFLLVAVALLIGFIDAWKKNFLGIREVVKKVFDGIKDIFKGAFEIIKGIWKVFSGFLTGDVDKIIEGFQFILAGLIRFARGIFGVILNVVKAILITIWNIITNVFNSIVGLVKRVGSFIGGLFGFGGGSETTNVTTQNINFSPTTNISTTGGVDSAGIKAGLNDSFAR